MPLWTFKQPYVHKRGHHIYEFLSSVHFTHFFSTENPFSSYALLMNRRTCQVYPWGMPLWFDRTIREEFKTKILSPPLGSPKSSLNNTPHLRQPFIWLCDLTILFTSFPLFALSSLNLCSTNINMTFWFWAHYVVSYYA